MGRSMTSYRLCASKGSVLIWLWRRRCADSSSHRLDSTSSFCDVAFSVFQPYHQPEPVARKMTLRGNFCTTMRESFCSLRRCFGLGGMSTRAARRAEDRPPYLSAAAAHEEPTR